MAEKEGIEAAGGTADLYVVPETLPPAVLAKMHAAPRDSNIPEITSKKLAEYDGFLFGVPTRYGNMPAQWKAFWDHTAHQWVSGDYAGKYAGVFVSTGTLGGGQEMTVLNMMSTFAHHGIIFVPLGYKTAGNFITNMTEIHGGSPWGAGTFALGDGSRQPTTLELDMAKAQAKAFYKILSKVNF